MTTRELGISLHEELDRREKLRAQLDTEIEALRQVLGIIERPTPEQHHRVTRVVGRRGRARRDTPPPEKEDHTCDVKPY